jgi:hypothetical protein
LDLSLFVFIAAILYSQNEEHNPQGLTPFINLNQTALTPVGVDAFVVHGGYFQ